jgi:hypothetical protein
VRWPSARIADHAIHDQDHHRVGPQQGDKLGLRRHLFDAPVLGRERGDDLRREWGIVLVEMNKSVRA